MKKVDRPLFPDFWTRFVRSLEALSQKVMTVFYNFSLLLGSLLLATPYSTTVLSNSMQGQRTVYRLTLVKGFNAEQVQQYADLVSIGDPDFIEVKVRGTSSCTLTNACTWLCLSLEYQMSNRMDACIKLFQGVTFCGDSKASKITMENVPWCNEVSL